VSYLLSDRDLLAALNELRWRDDLPKKINGLDTNRLIETAIDRLAQLMLEEKHHDDGGRPSPEGDPKTGPARAILER
jgi:hypothetical protein